MIAFTASRLGEFVDRGDEIQILGDREVLVEAKTLRHVADLQADPRCVADDVEPQAGAAAAVGLHQPAQHPDRGGFAAAVGAEKAADLTRRYREREAVDNLARAVTLVQIVDVDHQLAVMGRAPMVFASRRAHLDRLARIESGRLVRPRPGFDQEDQLGLLDSL